MAKEPDDIPRSTRADSHRDRVKTIRQSVVKSQRERFIDAAREVGTDDDPEAFNERLKKLVNAPTPKPVSERKKNAKGK